MIELMVPGLPRECELEFRVHVPFRVKVRSQPRSDPELTMPPPAPKKPRVTKTEFEHAHIPVVVQAIPLDSRSQPAREPGEPSDFEAPAAAASKIIE